MIDILCDRVYYESRINKQEANKMKLRLTKTYAEDGRLPEITEYPEVDLFQIDYPLFGHAVRTYIHRFEKMVFTLDTESVTIERID